MRAASNRGGACGRRRCGRRAALRAAAFALRSLSQCHTFFLVGIRVPSVSITGLLLGWMTTGKLPCHMQGRACAPSHSVMLESHAAATPVTVFMSQKATACES